ncbi:MAG: DMT family transporter [Oscillospiraceae bacterium]|nr:DMT family transporter [Oscillospiraceae bacterium]
MKQLRGVFLLTLTALIWGVSFVAQSAAADDIAPFTFIAVRSILASVFLFLIIVFRELSSVISKKSNLSVLPSQISSCLFNKRNLIGGLFCGIAITAATNFQQFAITAYPSGVAASGRTAFLTATYVIMIAAVSIFTGKKLHISTIIAAVVCLCGMYLLCMSNGVGGVYSGDLLALICAVGFTFHICIIDRFSDADALTVSFLQFFFCGIVSLILALIFQSVSFESIFNARIMLAYSGIMSAGVGYTLQFIGQKTAPPSIASIAMSLESVFAAIAGWILLGEFLSFPEICGCALVFIAVIFAQLPQFKKNKNA